MAAPNFAGRAPAFERPTRHDGANGKGREPSPTSTHFKKDAGRQHAAGLEQVAFDDLIAGHPRRAMEEVAMRSRLEAVKGEVEIALKMHGSMAKGERESWLKHIERRNEDDAYQVRPPE